MFRILVILLAVVSAFPQKVTEKFITEAKLSSNSGYYDNYNTENRIDFVHDARTGCYAYFESNYPGGKGRIVTPKGRSEFFDRVWLYNAKFDNNGNIFLIAGNGENSNNSKNYLLKNSVVIYTCERIRNFTVNDSIITFCLLETGNDYLIYLNHITGRASKIMAYDFKEFFSSTGNKHSFVMQLTDSAGSYLSIDGVEQKHYRKIFFESVKQDNAGEISYAAYNEGYFIVQGNKEFRHFSWMEIPVLFDINNVPVYAAGDWNPTRLMLIRGNDSIGLSYNLRITEIQLTPSGKIAYIGKNGANNTKKISCLVVDGNEVRKADDISNLTFTPNDEPVFIETSGALSYIVKGQSVLSRPEKEILDYRLINDKLYYLTVEENKDIDKAYYYHFAEKTIGACFKHEYYSIFRLCKGIEFIGNWKDYSETDVPAIYSVDSLGNYIYISSYDKDITKNQYINDLVYCCFNSNKTGPFFNVFNIAIYNSKPVFIGCKDANKNMSIYINMKPVTKVYDEIFNYSLDKRSGVITCLGKNGDSVYSIVVKL